MIDKQASAGTAGAGRRTIRSGWVAMVLSAAIILAALPFTWFPVDRPARDEIGGRTGGHMAVVRQWVNDPGSISIARFPEPKGVAFFAAATGWGRVFGTSCPAIRSMIVVLALGTVAAWAWLLSLWPLSRRFPVGLSLLTVPYFFICTQLLHTEIPSLLLTFLGLACATGLVRTGRLGWAVGTSLLLGLNLWVRQTFLIVPIALLICAPWTGRYRLRLASAALAACLAIVPMLILWGRLVPPDDVQRFQSGRIYPDVFAFALGVLGVMGWPLLLIGLPKRKGLEPLLLGAGLILGALLAAIMPLDYTSIDRMGLLQKALISLPFSPWLPGAVLRVAVCTGGLVSGRLAFLMLNRQEAGWIRFAALLALLGILLSLAAMPVFYDRYLILTIVLIFAMAAERARRPAATAFLCLFALLTVAHVGYVTRYPSPSAEPVPVFSKASLDLDFAEAKGIRTDGTAR